MPRSSSVVLDSGRDPFGSCTGGSNGVGTLGVEQGRWWGSVSFSVVVDCRARAALNVEDGEGDTRSSGLGPTPTSECGTGGTGGMAGNAVSLWAGGDAPARVLLKGSAAPSFGEAEKVDG